MPSSISEASMAPACRAARKYGSSGIVSSDANPKTARRTLPAAHSIPRSGPAKLTTVRSFSGDRRSARTSAIGFRRAPPPPLPMVIPSASVATAASAVERLSAMVALPRRLGFALLDEGRPRLVSRAGEVQLEGEALLEAVAALRGDR